MPPPYTSLESQMEIVAIGIRACFAERLADLDHTLGMLKM